MPPAETGKRSARAVELISVWGERVRANREQVERVRQGPERPDFYAPVSAHFVEDPRRTDDPVLDALLAHARRGERWLDIGAGAGRYALPLALRVGEVIAIDPSAGMLGELNAAMRHHGIENVRIIEGRWPQDADDLTADVALIAQVGYDIEEIGPFLDAMEAAADRLCVALMMDRSPASMADAFWPPVRGQERVPLPALPELVELLRARGADPRVERLPRGARRFEDPDELLAYLRRQLWVEEGSEADARLVDEVARRRAAGWDGLTLDTGPSHNGLVTWRPSRAGGRAGEVRAVRRT